MSCCGVTRAGRRCTLTTSSALKEAEPLRRGSDYCLFHARPFAANPCLSECPQSLEIILLDLETTGVSVVEDRIVELAAVQILPSNLPGCAFSATVFVETEIIETRGQEAAQVHGIGQAEIAVSPTFPQVWCAFLRFIDSLSNFHIQEHASDSDDDPRELPVIAEEPPVILIGAHNGIKFDFAMLLFECYRHNLDISIFERWAFVDTMHIVAAAREIMGPCLKLQCLAFHACDQEELRAHRARDDCVALCRVMVYVASRLGVSPRRLLYAFSQRLDLPTSLAQVSSMIETKRHKPCKGSLMQIMWFVAFEAQVISFFFLCDRHGADRIHYRAHDGLG